MFCSRPRGWLTVEPIMLVYMFASFLSYPTFQQLLYTTVCSDTPNCTASDPTGNATAPRCGNSSDPIANEVNNRVSHYLLYNNLALGIPAMIVALLYGSISDVYGRRPFVVLPAVGGALNAALVLTVFNIAPDNIYLYLIGSVVSGLAGGAAVFNFAVYSYAADNSCVNYRTSKLSVLESMTYLGATFSSFIGGVWIKEEGYVQPYCAVLTCYVCVVLYVVLFLPKPRENNVVLHTQVDTKIESLSASAGSKSNILLQTIWRISQFVRILFGSWKLCLLCFVFFTVEMNFMGISDIVILYSINKLCWSSDWIGYFLGSKVFFNAVAALFLLPLLSSVFSVNDTVIVAFGLISGIGALVTMGSATTTSIMLLAPIIGCLRGCVIPVVRSMLSKSTPPNYQGVMYSGISIVETASMLIASVVYNALFPATYSYSPGFCFYMMALVLLIPLSCVVILHVKELTPSKCVNKGEENMQLL